MANVRLNCHHDMIGLMSGKYLSGCTSAEGSVSRIEKAKLDLGLRFFFSIKTAKKEILVGLAIMITSDW